MKILMVRHGETDYNKNELVQGHTDIPLNETGIKQAVDAGEKLVGYKISAAYSSPMGRAYDTARYMLDNSGNESVEIEKDLRIIEKNFGKFEGVTSLEWKMSQARGDLESVEPDTVIAERIEEFYREMYNKHSDETILVVCHSVCIKVFLESKNIRPNDDFIINTSLNEIDFDGKEFVLRKYNA